jgi:hypothetical protein
MMLHQDRIEGAMKVLVRGKPVWAIPEDAPYPESHRWIAYVPPDINDFVPKE